MPVLAVPMAAHDAVLLIAFGGPEQPDDIRPFLERVTEGRRIPKERLEEVVHHYELIGGRSPFNELTFRQASCLDSLLRTRGIELPVYVGMRNWHPFFDETLARMRDAGHRHVLGIILSAFQSEASWERYMEDIAAAREKIVHDAPAVAYAPPWADHPLFIEAMSDRVAETLRRLPGEFSDPVLIFTAHSLPAAMAANSAYVPQFEWAARAVAEACSWSNWTLAYQSRSGRPADPWLAPDVGDVIERLADENRAVVVAPIGFVCDHVEVLYDLDYEANARAQELGLAFYRVPTVNDHPLFIEMLAELVTESLERS